MGIRSIESEMPVNIKKKITSKQANSRYHKDSYFKHFDHSSWLTSRRNDYGATIKTDVPLLSCFQMTTVATGAAGSIAVENPNPNKTIQGFFP